MGLVYLWFGHGRALDAERDERVGPGVRFRLWALLTEQSRGQLHVFLPLTDRGIDALAHRLTDGTYFRVQAKARSSLVDGEVHLVVWASAPLDDEVLLVAARGRAGGGGIK